MAVNVTGADGYIGGNCIDIEDWSGADTTKKQRLLNVASRTLTTKYPTYTIPDNAVYEFANVLAIVFNDTNKYAQYGVQSTSLTGVVSTTFRDGTAKELSQMIPQAALDLINADPANDELAKVSKRAAKWTVM